MFYYLPKLLVRIKGAAKEADYTITVSAEYAADGNGRYFLEMRGNPFYEDHSTLEVDARGLLTSVDITAEDKTGEIIGDIAAIAAKAMTFGVGVAPGLRSASEGIPPFDVTFEIGEFPKIRNRLLALGLDVKLEKSAPTMTSISAFEFAERKNGQSKPVSGIVFRPGIPYTLKISDGPLQQRLLAKSRTDLAKDIKNKKQSISQLELAESSDPQVKVSQTARLHEELEDLEAQYASLTPAEARPLNMLRAELIVPDANTPLVFPLGRTPFSKRTDTLTFTNGMLTKVHRARPSVILGFLQIPKQILTTLTPLPLELKQTQVNNIKASRELETLLGSKPPTPNAP